MDKCRHKWHYLTSIIEWEGREIELPYARYCIHCRKYEEVEIIYDGEFKLVSKNKNENVKTINYCSLCGRHFVGNRHICVNNKEVIWN